jgi:uncharacterized protein (DUF2132 family)
MKSTSPARPARPAPATDEARDESGHLVRALHGKTLAHIVETLLADLGWEGLAERVRINCFVHDPSVKSSLTFLRRTPWARAEVEALYVERALFHQRNAQNP